MVTIELLNPDLDKRAKYLLKYGGICFEWELLEVVAREAVMRDIDVRFVRHEPTGDIVYDPEMMLASIEMGMEVRPVS